MNPETIDLSTWRSEAPPAELRSRALRPRCGAPLPRFGVVVFAAAGFGLVLVVATAPARAEALWRNAAAASTKGLVHLIDETSTIASPGTGLGRTEVWMAPGVKRTRITGGWLEEGTVWKQGGVNDMISVTLGPEMRATSEGGPALRIVRDAWRAGHVARSFPAAKAFPVGTFLIRRGKHGLTVEHVSPLTFPTFSSPFDPKTITERFARSGGAKIEEIEGAERVRRLLIGGAEPWRYRITIDRESRRLIECESEVCHGASWVRVARSRFDYPESFPHDLFDPETMLR